MNSKRILKNRLVVSLFICFYGMFILYKFQINIFLSIFELADGYQQFLGFLSGSDVFVKSLESSWLFENIFRLTEYQYSSFYLFFINSLLLQNVINYLYRKYLFKNSDDLNKIYRIILNIIYIVTNYFLIFISNYFCMYLLKFISIAFKLIYSNFAIYIIQFWAFFEANLIVQILCFPVLAFLAILLMYLISIVLFIIFFNYLEFCAIIITYLIIFTCHINIKVWLSVLITVVIKLIIKLLSNLICET